MSEIGRKPDYNVTAKVRGDLRASKVGAAWKNDDGTINIVLDPFVKLEGSSIQGAKLYITLYPPDWKMPEKEHHGVDPRAAAKAGQRDDLEDDTPF